MCTPTALERLSCSEPPKSARQRVERTSRKLASVCTSERVRIACARDERSFITVAARRLARSALSSSSDTCVSLSMVTSANPDASARAATPRHAPRCSPSLRRSVTSSPYTSTKLIRNSPLSPCCALRVATASISSRSARGTRPAAGSRMAGAPRTSPLGGEAPCPREVADCSSGPDMVNVLPEPVCPKQSRQPERPLSKSTISGRSDFSYTTACDVPWPNAPVKRNSRSPIEGAQKTTFASPTCTTPALVEIVGAVIAESSVPSSCSSAISSRDVSPVSAAEAGEAEGLPLLPASVPVPVPVPSLSPPLLPASWLPLLPLLPLLSALVRSASGRA
mmetsp:Transcript_8295/g.21226  ORF Transcript_8295/g.21226 Transcript_8295/m.21226 type:complete len:336 (-) Transcript_8295:606-1613(-)